MKITKQHIGQPGEFTGTDGKKYYGNMVNKSRNIITFKYYIPGKAGEFVGYFDNAAVKQTNLIIY